MSETYRSRVGTTPDGDYVVVDLEVRVRDGAHETTAHGEIVSPIELAFMGSVHEKGHRNAYAAGQVSEHLAQITEPARGWTLAEVAELREIWDTWHLNTMRGACEHQTVVWEEAPYRRPSLELTEPCPITGYRYGHAWLVAPLPPEVLNRARHLMRDRGRGDTR